MLRQRIATAAVLLPVVILALFYLPSSWLALLLGAFVLAAAWEWTLLTGFTAPWSRALYVAVLGAAGAAGYAGILYRPGWVLAAIAASVLWWLWGVYGLLRRDGGFLFATRPGRAVSGLMILLPAWLAAVYLHSVDPRRPAVLLFLFVLVWSADSSAYFIGKAWGRRKLAPHISPGKTVEGSLGGLAAVVLLSALCGIMIWNYESWQLAVWVAIAMVTMVFSVVGDLMESRFKRQARVKDSGHLLPGHGGVLDRIDALTAAAPVFAAAWATLLGSPA